MAKQKMVVIYSPTDNEPKYTTSTVVSEGGEYKLAKSIEATPQGIEVVVIEDGKDEKYLYGFIPYCLNEWEREG